MPCGRHVLKSITGWITMVLFVNGIENDSFGFENDINTWVKPGTLNEEYWMPLRPIMDNESSTYTDDWRQVQLFGRRRISWVMHLDMLQNCENSYKEDDISDLLSYNRLVLVGMPCESYRMSTDVIDIPRLPDSYSTNWTYRESTAVQVRREDETVTCFQSYGVSTSIRPCRIVLSTRGVNENYTRILFVRFPDTAVFLATGEFRHQCKDRPYSGSFIAFFARHRHCKGLPTGWTLNKVGVIFKDYERSIRSRDWRCDIWYCNASDLRGVEIHRGELIGNGSQLKQAMLRRNSTRFWVSVKIENRDRAFTVSITSGSGISHRSRFSLSVWITMAIVFCMFSVGFTSVGWYRLKYRVIKWRSVRTTDS
ncbi:t22.3 [Tupaiid betaherpesvirus 1]|uniref:T22.3 n=1 Tax=Tupaiid herpesvirus 1 (strain 1) TaxID=10397 RepID=Q91TT6_TUHV1|nr:t22.3 [Tupaiid betaherpesvirus 1]AAK57051.1 t22.3 [Tupaiid betaherpesvirus 1]